MANRELVIVFVYDTLKCTKEEDNPDDAVLFFHPGWVSEQQRISLCGQLMGTSFFIASTFSQPRILCLQSGKFAIRYFGQYIMAMGTDRNIPEWVLEQRAELMTALLKLYFKDMDSLAASCVSSEKQSDIESSSQTSIINSSEDSWDEFRFKTNPATLPEKLSRIFETFLPIVQYTGQIFANVPMVRLPKSATNVYLEGIRILRSCQELKGVLGGTLLYQNKVVASQLSSSLTKQLVITDPYRIKSPAENVPTSFSLPVGVQLLKIYVCGKELRSLRKKAKNVRSTFPKAEAASKLNGVKSHRDSQPELLIKQNRSHIFTVPEEDDSEADTAPNKFVENIERRSKPLNAIIPSPDQAEEVLQEVILEPAPPPVSSKGANLVCSTPARDVNVLKLLHGKAMSICNNAGSDTIAALEDISSTSNQADIIGDKIKGECFVIPDVVRDAVEARKAARRSRSDITFRDGLSNPSDDAFVLPLRENKIEFLSREPIRMPLSTSLDSVHQNTTVVSLRYYSLGLPGIPVNRKGSPSRETPERSPSPPLATIRHGGRRSRRRKPTRNFYHTITDPCFPIFWNDGVALSRSLFDQYLRQHYQLLGSTSQPLEIQPEVCPAPAKPVKEAEVKPVRRRPSDLPVIPIANSAPVTNPPLPSTAPPNSIDSTVPKPGAPKEAAPSRRPLSLALNTVTETQGGESTNDPPESRRKRVASQALPPVARPTSLSGGLALTPLMAKLSHLAVDRHGTTGIEESQKTEHKEAFPQRVETPITPRPPPTLTRRSESRERTESLAEEDTDDSNSEDVVLFVCGMQSMTLLLIVERSAATSEEVVQSLREITSNTLESLELLLHRSMDNFPSSNDGPDMYSYMCLDPQWGATQRGGVWSANDLELVGSLRKDFCNTRTLTEVCFRSQDSLVYGYQCGGSQVFYQQQTVTSGPGLPTPADVMGTVPLKARRCLERDHGIILL